MEESRTDGAPPERSQREREAFLARLAGGLAHEIKNPLSTMAINLTLLEEEWDGTLQGKEAPEPSARERRGLKRVQKLQREVSRLEGIVDDFLRFARGGEVNRSPQDLVACVREVLEFVEPENEVSDIRSHVDLPSKLPLAMLDVGLFKQALINLLVNGRQAMPGGGELILKLERKGNRAELTVTDTGFGMDEAELGRCFDLYWSTKKNGTGLGLSTVARIVEEHEGHISVVSEKGRGTSFSIVLPLLVELAGNRPEEGGETS
jgi:two-component system, NtrC family, sensor histidine kinase HydH